MICEFEKSNWRALGEKVLGLLKPLFCHRFHVETIHPSQFEGESTQVSLLSILLKFIVEVFFMRLEVF